MLAVAAIAAGLALLLIANTLTPRLQLAVAAALAVPQLFDVAPRLPLGVWWPLVCLPSLVGRRSEATRRALAPVWALLGIGVIYVSWSPTPSAALYPLASLLSFAAAVLLAASVVHEPGGFRPALVWLGIGVVAESVLTTAFRNSPSLESRFLHLRAARFICGNAIQGLYTTNTNNVVEASKAGGVFLNGNAASMFLGVAGMLFLAAYLRFRRRSYLLVTIFAAVGVVETGSKTGLALLILVPAIALAFWYLLRFRSLGLNLPFATLVGLVAVIIGRLVLSVATNYSEESAQTLGIRQRIWGVAQHGFESAPFAGTGWGGWTRLMEQYSGAIAVPPSYAAHNFVIQAWSDTGLAGALITVVFIASTLGWAARGITRSPSHRLALSSAVAGGGFLWIFVHGMGDNTVLFGEAHTAVIAAMLLASLTAAGHFDGRRMPSARPESVARPEPHAKAGKVLVP